jgi:uncharacterized protein YqgV (UPF0045/DUF77 family)
LIQVHIKPVCGRLEKALTRVENQPMIVSAQISVYPLRQQSLGPVIESVAASLAARGLEPQMGTMSTAVTGEGKLIFAALADAFAEAARQGDVAMNVTVSNACPLTR